MPAEWCARSPPEAPIALSSEWSVSEVMTAVASPPKCVRKVAATRRPARLDIFYLPRIILVGQTNVGPRGFEDQHRCRSSVRRRRVELSDREQRRPLAGGLRRETDFTNGVGKGSRPGPSSIQRAFTSLVRHRGTAAFLALTTSEESAPRLFGLRGLKHLDAPEYADVQRRLVEDRETVRGHVGCIRVNDTVGGVLAHEYGKSGRTVFDVICSELIVNRPGAAQPAPLQRTGASVAALPLAPTAERLYR